MRIFKGQLKMYSAIIQLCHILSNDFESTPALGAGGSDDLKVGKVSAAVVSLWNWETETTSRHSRPRPRPNIMLKIVRAVCTLAMFFFFRCL